MGWSLLSGGKRLRPLVVCTIARALQRATANDDDEQVWEWVRPAAVAIELVHTYSLIHDDLPALDDDDLRRGRPTVHKAFDEATAVLAGDALLTDAFFVLAGAPKRAMDQVRELALAAGSAAMVGGQCDDLRGEGQPIDLQTLRRIHARKTGRLFAAAGALAAFAVDADATCVTQARAFGAALGFAFQVQDDVLDVTGNEEKGGKARGRDLKNDKATYVRLLGLDGARSLARSAGTEAVGLAEALSDDPRLAALARFSVERDH